MAGEYLGDKSKGWGQKKKVSLQRSSDGFPDLIIYEANRCNTGLAIELKTIKGTPFLKDGQFASAYRKGGKKYNQVLWLDHLESIGFETHFGIGYDHTKKIIDNYLQNRQPNLKNTV